MKALPHRNYTFVSPLLLDRAPDLEGLDKSIRPPAALQVVKRTIMFGLAMYLIGGGGWRFLPPAFISIQQGEGNVFCPKVKNAKTPTNIWLDLTQKKYCNIL